MENAFHAGKDSENGGKQTDDTAKS